jgi:16S rRNA processing protein RimM
LTDHEPHRREENQRTDEPERGRLEVGRIIKAHGLRGEVVVDLLSDYPDVRLAIGSRLWAGTEAVTVRAARTHQGRWLVRLDGVTDRTAAERLAGRALTGEGLDDPDALWVHELVGSKVVESRSGAERGTVVAVVANPAHDLLELDGGQLVPIVFVRSFDGGVVTIDPPEGLFDLDGPG